MKFARYRGMTLVMFLLLVLLYSYVEGVHVVRKAPELGRNVCIVEKEKVHVTLRRKITTRHRKIVKDCGITDKLSIKCEQQKIEAVISYIPRKTVTRTRTVDCCPGWKDYKPSLGCFEPGPCLSLPQNTPQHCHVERSKKLTVNQAIYTLSKPPKTPTEDFSDPKNLQKAFVFPLLNLTTEQVFGLSGNDFHELPWLLIYKYLLETFRDFLEERLKPETHLFDKFNSTSDFIGLYKIVRGLLTKDGNYKEYFRYPSLEEKFKDIIHCDHWKDDQVFVEQRLAGLNPMSLQKLTSGQGVSQVGISLSDIKAKGKLNMNFDWDTAMSLAVGEKTSLDKMVKDGSVFVAHFPYLDGLTNPMDIMDLNQSDARKIKKSTSPIALFVSVKSSESKPNQLRPIAIQLDRESDSPVYQSSDGHKWLLAKQIFQVADFAHAEMIEHLLKTHLVLEPICVVAKRALSEFHPLSHLLRWHCRGLFVTNSYGLPRLVLPNGYMHKLFAIGNVGAIELLNKGYADMSWEDVDFLKNIKKRGVADKSKLSYFPYRDDGYIIWRQIQSFLQDYVRLYYRQDTEVRRDSELQNFANELSRDGTGKIGGIGMLKGFPKSIDTKGSLIETFTRILWLPVQHDAVNYPIAYYGAFVPNMPTRLYDDPRGKPDEFSFYTLPDSHVATVQSSISMSLGSLRYDKLLDYSSQMEDENAAEVVSKHYKILMTYVKRILDQRNERRIREGHLTYPYLVPGWIPNSIHT